MMAPSDLDATAVKSECARHARMVFTLNSVRYPLSGCDLGREPYPRA
jgi:hypothetical protein